MAKDILDTINPQVRSDAERFQREFASNGPFPHLVIDDFLEPGFCRELIEQFPAFDTSKAINEYGEVGGKACFENVRELGTPYRRFDDVVRSRPFLDLLGRITDVPGIAYDPEYFGGGTHENRSGQDLDAHIDFNYHPKTGQHRRLNLIVFLNPEWKREWGGCLKLQSSPWHAHQAEAVEVVPLANRCVMFATSEESWHGFDRIRIPQEQVAQGVSRRSLSVYFYSDDRPREEIAPSHSTIYAPPPLPDCLAAGQPLSEEEVAEIRALVSRRDAQIRFLYEREKEWAAERSRLREMIADIDRSPTFRLVRFLGRPLKFLLRK